MDPKTCCLPYRELCEYLHVNPDTFRLAWKELPHYFAPGTEGYNLKAARFDLLDVVNHLKEVGRVCHKVQDQRGDDMPSGVREPRGKASKSGGTKAPGRTGKKWRVERVAMGESI